MNISVNKLAKDFLCGKFKLWYVKIFVTNFKVRLQRLQIDLQLSVAKPLGFEWMTKLCT